MVRNKYQEDLTDGWEGNNDLEVMISSFGLQEGRYQRFSWIQRNKRTALWNTVDKFKMDFLVYGMEISLGQSNVSLNKLALSFRGIVLVLVKLLHFKGGWQHAYIYNISLLLENVYWYIQVTIFHELDLNVVHLFIIQLHFAEYK